MDMPSRIDWSAVVWKFGFSDSLEMLGFFQDMDISVGCSAEFLGLDTHTILNEMRRVGVEPRIRGYWQSNRVNRRL
jgi:hypothetical protein